MRGPGNALSVTTGSESELPIASLISSKACPPSWTNAGLAKRDGRVFPGMYICSAGVLSGGDGKCSTSSSPSIGHTGVLGNEGVGGALVYCAGLTLPRRAGGNSSAGRPRPMTGTTAHHPRQQWNKWAG